MKSRQDTIVKEYPGMNPNPYECKTKYKCKTTEKFICCVRVGEQGCNILFIFYLYASFSYDYSKNCLKLMKLHKYCISFFFFRDIFLPHVLILYDNSSSVCNSILCHRCCIFPSFLAYYAFS